MELKNYQKAVIGDLQKYLDALIDTGNNPIAAWKMYHGESAPKYNDKISGVANVCLKVPTGGSKTFLACAALNHIVNCLSPKYRFVIWLVPSDAILTQTLANLANTAHPYRQRIDNDFNHNVAMKCCCRRRIFLQQLSMIICRFAFLVTRR